MPPENEVVMSPGMKITATTPEGTITITAGKGLKRSYTWEGATQSVHKWPRMERWYGSLGLYFPGSGHHWKEHNGVTRGVLEEKQLHFDTLEQAEEYFEQGGVYRNDGLKVGWGKDLSRKQLTVIVVQIYVDGRRPTKLAGAQDDKIVVEKPTESDEELSNPRTDAVKSAPDGVQPENESVMVPGMRTLTLWQAGMPTPRS